MLDVNVYYCWACDAHRRVDIRNDGTAQCPRCGHELTPDAKLPFRGISSSKAEGAVKIVWPAPVRPRLAASA
jgi:uncharacterized paraquat-inducible protein A